MTKKNTFITQFSRTPEQIRDCSVVSFTQPSKVKESLSYAVDINTIYENYCKTGNLPLNGQQPIYDDNFVKLDDLIEAQHTVKEACQYFQSLPAEIRVKYGNSLEKFVSAVHSNDKFLLDKGVLVKKESLTKPSTEVDNPSLEGSINGPINVDKPIVQPTIQPTIEKPVVDSSTTA